MNSDNNRKRWLVTGVVLHSVLTPALREHVTVSLDKLYDVLKRTDNINKQIYPHHLTCYRGACLNYEAINRNKKLGHRKQSRLDYKVKDAVELSKLFVGTHMANFGAFDDSCNLSTLLEIIIGCCPLFSTFYAIEVKHFIQEPWFQLDITKWDNGRYMKCMGLIMDFIESLKLKNQRMLTELFYWKQNGKMYIDDTMPYHPELSIRLQISIQVQDMLKAMAITSPDPSDQILNLKKELITAVYELERDEKLEEIERLRQKFEVDEQRLSFNYKRHESGRLKIPQIKGHVRHQNLDLTHEEKLQILTGRKRIKVEKLDDLKEGDAIAFGRKWYKHHAIVETINVSLERFTIVEITGELGDLFASSSSVGPKANVGIKALQFQPCANIYRYKYDLARSDGIHPFDVAKLLLDTVCLKITIC